MRPAAGRGSGPLLRGRPDHGRGGPAPRGCRDHRPSARRRRPGVRRRSTAERSAALAWAVERALATAGIEPEPARRTECGRAPRSGWRASVSAVSGEIDRRARRRRGTLRVSLQNLGGERDPRRGADPQPARDVVDDHAVDPGIRGRAGRGDRSSASASRHPGTSSRGPTGRWSRSCTSGACSTRSRCRSRSWPRRRRACSTSSAGR